MRKTILTMTLIFACSAIAFAGDSTEVKHKMDSTEHKHMMDSTEHKHMMDSSEHKHMMDSSEHKHMMDSSEHKHMMDSTEMKHKITTTKSGLMYFDSKMGDGAEAKKGSNIEVHYTGWVYKDGKKVGKPFDSSLKRGKPIAFQLGAGRMIRGWEEGLVGVKVGGKRTLIIPSDLGYGKRGGAGGAIPPNATLIFETEMMSVK